MHLVIDESDLRALIRPIVAEVIAGILAAKFFGVSERQVYRWERTGRIRATRLGKLVKYHRDELERVAREGVAAG